MRIPIAAMLLAAGGCEWVFPLSGGGRDAGGGGEGPAGRDIPHVAAADEWIAGGNVALDGITIDTTTGTATPPVAAGVISLVDQDGPGPPLAILRASDLVVMDLRVVGARPLVILARTITVSGFLDAAAALDRPGPGAGVAGTGGPGGNLTLDDAGGGGGGFAPGAAEGGGTGASAACSSVSIGGGIGGAEHGTPDLAVLVGGGNGGTGHETGCTGAAGGGGGGAIQLSALETITLGPSAIIDGGGGGGGGGADCDDNNDGGAGGGGGSGGAIYLDAPVLALGGVVVAHGGAGGAGGCGNAGDGAPGEDGQPGRAALGGLPVPSPPCSRLHGGGGVGATATTEAGPGVTVLCGNAGGGGGAVGRIVLRRQTETGTAVISPPAFVVTF
jgi:hypothetical protein